jgi:renalase
MILFAAPAPEVAEILAAGNLGPSAKEVLGTELGRVRYRRCISLALAYPGRVERPYYALVNIDRGHPIAWLAFEHDKGPERCPLGYSLLLAQLAPQFSHDHWETPNEDLTRAVAEQVSGLLGAELRRPLWGDVRRWRHALPDAGAGFDTLNGAGAASGLFFAGDYTMEPGRVHLAIESGWRAAALIDTALSC